jgi:predicted RNA-binding Zn-ribbon protein involved in translation (DUF1610 family)
MSGREQDSQDHEARPASGTDAGRFLKTGTYLHTYCPHCSADLLDERRVHLTVIAPGGERGKLKLSPRFNVFDRQATIDIEPGTEFGDLCCPRCGRSIIEPEVHCKVCSAKTARIRVSAVHLDFDLYICARAGCPWHGLTEEDRKRIILDENPEEQPAESPEESPEESRTEPSEDPPGESPQST